MIKIILIILLLILLFFIFNSIIWIKNKKSKNINDIVIKYIIYINFVVVISLLIFISYLYYNGLNIIINKL
jgi:hypothetical protein